MSLVTKIEDHADRGARLLVTQFRESPLLDGLLRAVLARLQDMEDVVDDVRLLRWLDTAEGVQLDTIGRHVDELRGERTDEDYRDGLRLRIFINASRAEPETVREIFRRLTGSTVTRLWENAPAALQLFGNGSTHPAGLAATMTSVAPAAAGIVPVTLSFGTVPFIVSDNFEYARLAVTEDGAVIDLLNVDTQDTGEQHEVLLNPGVSAPEDLGLGFAEVNLLGVVDGTGAGRLVEVFQLAPS